MILFTDVSISEINKKGKKYNWRRPKCKKCNAKVWGHGFVTRYFNSVRSFLWIKRWRCSCCGTIYICRPREYWSRYQEKASNIFKALIYRVTHLKWPPWISRQRGGHWLMKLIKNARANLLLKKSILKTILFYQEKNLAIN